MYKNDGMVLLFFQTSDNTSGLETKPQLMKQLDNRTNWARVRHSPQHTVSTDGLSGWCHLCTNPTSIFAHNHKSELCPWYFLTEYFALVASSSPSLSQLIIGFGFPWAEQLSAVLPPSFASTYCAGVSVNEGGAGENIGQGILGTIPVSRQKNLKSYSMDWHRPFSLTAS